MHGDTETSLRKERASGACREGSFSVDDHEPLLFSSAHMFFHSGFFRLCLIVPRAISPGIAKSINWKHLWMGYLNPNYALRWIAQLNGILGLCQWVERVRDGVAHRAILLTRTPRNSLEDKILESSIIPVRCKR